MRHNGFIGIGASLERWMEDERKGEGDHELLEQQYGIKLLALLCLEVEKTVPPEDRTARLRQLLQQGEAQAAAWCDFDSWHELARVVEADQQALEQGLRRAAEQWEREVRAVQSEQACGDRPSAP